HTTPPMLMARAPKAGAVQPRERKTAQVAIRVAIAMPEIGLAEVPIRPTMRDDTVTKRKPKITTKTAAARFASIEVWAFATGWKVSMAHIISRMSREPEAAIFMSRSRSVRLVLAAAAAPLPRSAKPALRAATM